MDFPQNMGPFRHLLFGLAALLATTAMQMPKAAIAQSNAIKNASDPTGLKVTTTYDPAKNTANIVATNISGKDVTAYDLSVDVSYEGDIKDHHELMIDRSNWEKATRWLFHPVRLMKSRSFPALSPTIRC